MRIDAHQHFWQYSPVEHNWMTAAMGSLKRDYLPDDLKPLLAESGLEGTVAVQARQSLKETEWLLGLADQYDLIKGVVGWVDLRAPDVEAQLAKYGSRSKFKGVRHVVLGNYRVTSQKFLASAMGFPPERLLLGRVAELGHCFSADFLVTLAERATDGTVAPGDRVAAAATGTHSLSMLTATRVPAS